MEEEVEEVERWEGRLGEEEEAAAIMGSKEKKPFVRAPEEEAAPYRLGRGTAKSSPKSRRFLFPDGGAPKDWAGIGTSTKSPNSSSGGLREGWEEMLPKPEE